VAFTVNPSSGTLDGTNVVDTDRASEQAIVVRCCAKEPGFYLAVIKISNMSASDNRTPVEVRTLHNFLSKLFVFEILPP